MLKYGALKPKNFILFKLILFLKTIDSIMEQQQSIMICICLIHFIQIKLDILNFLKIKKLLKNNHSIKNSKIQQKKLFLD